MSETLKNNKLPAGATHALEILLGIGLVLIAYDYARDFLSGNNFSPTDLRKTSLQVFMSRWVTYFGAPILMFVAGVQVAFRRLLGWQNKEMAIYLIKRGVFLLFIDLVIVSFGFNFSFSYPAYFMMLGVLGLSYFVLAGLVFLPLWVSFVFGLSIVLGHDLLPTYVKADNALLVLFHGSGAVKIFDHTLFLIYSLIPWLGVVAMGYGVGGLYNMDAPRRRRLFMRTGMVLTLGFIALRLINDYGNPEHWWIHSEAFFSFLAFINVSKFPASVQYLLMTLGPIFMLLSWLEGRGRLFLSRFAVYGKTPLFFYICTTYLIHIFAVMAGGLQGYQPLSFIAPVWQFPPSFGFGFLAVLTFSLVLFAAIYPVCKFVDSALGSAFFRPDKAVPVSWLQNIKSQLRNF